MSYEATLAVLRHTGVLFESTKVGENTYPYLANFDGDHIFHDHTPLWNYENPIYAQPYSSPNAKPLFVSLAPQTTIHDALLHTSLIVFLGAAPTPSLRAALENPNVLILIFDLSSERIAQVAKEIGIQRLVGRVHIFLGHLESFLPPLGMSLPASIFSKGFPVFFTLPGVHAIPNYEIKSCVELFEILFYRHVLYPLSGQWNKRGLPLRPMKRDLFYDQQFHLYKNIKDYVQSSDISVLRRAFHNETAVLIAAGPDLPSQMEYLRHQREKGIFICVNTALKPLLAADIHPHFVVINDASIAAGKTLSGLPQLKDIRLVGDIRSDLGGDSFPVKYIFGTHRPELFGSRPTLRFHGSVITTALSLAHHMGCSRCVLVGVQLCSDNPWVMSYSKGSIHENKTGPARPLINAFPQLVPKFDIHGESVYTTLNFLDAALWFKEEVRTNGMVCVNISAKSILYGKGIQFEKNYDIPFSSYLYRRFRQLSRPCHKEMDNQIIQAVVKSKYKYWEQIRDACITLSKLEGSFLIQAGFDILSHFDKNNISYLVQRFSDFDNMKCHNLIFSESVKDQEIGLRYLFVHVKKMCESFMDVIALHADF